MLFAGLFMLIFSVTFQFSYEITGIGNKSRCRNSELHKMNP